MSVPAPLSLGQQSLWFLHRLAPASQPAFNVRTALRIRGPLQPAAVRAALQAVVDHHDELRAYFEAVDESPVRRIAPAVRCDVPVIDFSTLDGTERERALRAAMDEEGRHEFELDRAPLFRGRLLRLAADDWYLLLNAHHLIADAWSLAILLREMSAAYRSLENARDFRLPATTCSYAEFVEWQRRRLATTNAAEDLEFWKTELSGAEPLRLPIDGSPRLATHDGASCAFVVAPETTEALRALSRRENATLFHTLLAAYAVLLHRYSGQTDFTIGTSVAGRDRVEFESLIGFLADLLLVRQDLSGSPTFTELIDRVRRRCLDALRHQHAPYDTILRDISPARSGEAHLLFQASFLFTKDAATNFDVPTLTAESHLLPSVTAKYPLSLHVEDLGDRLRGLIEYRTDSFSSATIERLARHWQQLLEELARHPDRSLHSIVMLDDDECGALTTGRNALRAVAPPRPTIHDWFALQASHQPARVAISHDRGELTYGELDTRANRLAWRLRRRGVERETRVGLCVGRSVDAIAAMLAILKAGGAYVPLDPAYPAARLDALIADSGISLVLAGRAEAEKLAVLQNRLQILELDAESDEGVSDPDGPPSVECDAANAAYVIYTSGSTGQPKGVVVTHDNVTRLFSATAGWFGFGPEDVWTLFHSFSFDFSVWEIWGALLNGGRLVLVPYLTSRSAEAFRRLLVDERVTVLNQTPSAFRQLAAVDSTSPEPASLALRWIIFGGEALDPAILRPWVGRYGGASPRLVNMYGITETTVHVTFRPLGAGEIADQVRSVIGERIPDLELYVLDAALRPVPEGVTGEVFVGGAGLARGYLGKPALTAERFVPNPYSPQPGSRLYRTGDTARWLAGGDLEYLGRADAQIKIRGFRVEPGEIEHVLRQHDSVQDAVVDLHGSGEGSRLAAYVVPAGRSQTTAVALHEWCAARLPAHMVPAVFVPVTSWPLTPNGKLDRAALPVPGELAHAHRGDSAPQTDTERKLADAWAEVLGLGRIGRDDNFFELGGDSILCLRVLAGMRRRGLACSIADLYRCGNVRELAAIVEAADDGVATIDPFSLVSQSDRLKLPGDVVDAYPVSRLQMGMLFHRELTPNAPVYHDVFSFHLRLPWNPAAFETAVQHLVDIHPALQTGFDTGAYSEPLQLVHASATARCTFADVSVQEPAGQEQAIAEVVAVEQATDFELAAPPLCRFHVVRRSDGAVQIVVGFHHAILDGWSFASLVTSLVGAFVAAGQGRAMDAEATPSPALAIALEQRALASEDTRRFWRSEPLPGTRLPRDPAAPHGAGSMAAAAHRIGRLPVPLPASISSGLHEVATRAGVHVKSVVLAAHLLALGRLTGQQQVVTGLVMNTRPETDATERTLGLFLNTLPFCVELSHPTLLDLVRAVAARERELLPHRRFPMQEIRQMRGGRTLFDTAFNFVHFHVYRQLLQPGGLDVLGYDFREETNFPFLAQFTSHPDGTQIELLLVYDATQFPEAHVRRIAGCYRQILEASVAQPDAAPREYRLTSRAEVAEVLAWRGEERTYPETASLPAWFSAVAAAHGDAVAVTADDGELTYAALDAQSTQLAHALRRCGVQPETRVGLVMERTAALVVGVLGILKAGGAYVPVDPASPAARLAFILADSGVTVLLTDGRVVVPELPGVTVIDITTAGAMETTTPLAPGPDLDQAAYVIYTSGSTGQPKGVVVTHRQVTRLFQAAAAHFAFTAQDVWTLFHSIAFDFSVWELWGALLTGGRLVVVSYEVSRTPERFYALLAEAGVTVLNQTPSAFRQLLAIDTNVAERRALALRYVVFGGEALDLGMLAPWVGQHGDEAPELINMYGITETTVHVTYRRLRRADITGGAGSLIGQPLGDLQLYVLDEQMAPLPCGVPGELYVGGGGVARGYLAQPALTATRFLPNPFGSGRLYRTGDAGRWLPAGEVEYLGRLDDQVKLRGFRIELGEIVTVLRQHAGLRDAVVVARPQAAGEVQLVAYGVAHGGHAPRPTPTELRACCQQWLPAHMVPAAFVLLDTLPVTRHGKLDRDALPPPDVETDTAAGAAYVAPSSELERQLCGIWQEVLDIAPIGIAHNFFDLGGHSILATQLVSRIRHAFGIELPFRALFDAPTVQAMAPIVAQQRAIRVDPPAAIPRARRALRQVIVASDGTLIESEADRIGR